jgi:hypothetical protein
MMQSDSDMMQQIRMIVREELELSKRKRSDNQELTDDERRITEFLPQIARDWVRTQGQETHLTPAIIKRCVYGKSMDLGIMLESKATWLKVCAWMLEEKIFTKVQKGPNNTTTVYLVGPAILESGVEAQH